MCTGILIWKIDQSITENYDAVNSPPSYGGGPHRGVVLVEADGNYDMIKEMNYGQCSDTWQVGQVWNDTTKPNTRLWDGSSSGLSVEIVTQVGTSIDIQVTVSNDPCTGTPVAPVLESPENEIVTYNRRVTLRWIPSSCLSTIYKIWVMRGSLTGRVVSKAWYLRKPIFKTKFLASRRRYYWIVQACNDNGCTYSDYRSFRIG